MYRPQSGSIHVLFSVSPNHATEPGLDITELKQPWLLGGGKCLTLSYNYIPSVEIEWTDKELPHDNQVVYI